MKLLVRTTNWLGDAVMSIPALREIRGAFPGWEITLLARPWVADLYAREDFGDHILRYENHGRHQGLSGKWKLAAQLRQTRFDCAILLPNAFDAALIAWLARIPRRIGYARDARGPLLTDAIALPKKGSLPAHERFYYLELLRRAGLIEQLPDCPDIRLSGAALAAESGREEWKRRKLAAKRWIGVSPGAAYGGAKRWAPERFAEAAAALAAELDAGIAIFGSKAEAELCGWIADRAGPQAHNLAGTTSLAEFIDLAATCTVYLANDSGPMHVAAALGIPTVAVFGATDHIATGPVSERACVVREPVDCSPCLLRECPIDHRCMERVTSSKVVGEALSLLANARERNTDR